MEVRFTPSGRAQFLAAVAYIRSADPGAARGFRRQAERLLRRLERFPRSGRIIPEFPDLPYREVIVRPYRFFYRAEGKTVWIVAVWHGAQRPARPRGSRGLPREPGRREHLTPERSGTPAAAARSPSAPRRVPSLIRRAEAESITLGSPGQTILPESRPSFRTATEA
ncbi:MAG TPA: type II toxin-antitoxin system RelE/ParE family toxin [Methylomirabilota bacterium]|nr:type II toxin-antitoxin system RelE/ParE family toxin [Methylomirabilota bacterium]